MNDLKDQVRQKYPIVHGVNFYDSSRCVVFA